jgi:hypothetical protein
MPLEKKPQVKMKKNFFRLTRKVTQNHWVYGLCPSFGILNNKKTRFGNWICFQFQVRRGRDLLCWAPWKELISITGLVGVGRGGDSFGGKLARV